MFKNLSDLAYKRTTKESWGFYLAYLLLSILIGAIAGLIVGLVTGLKGTEGFQAGFKVGNACSVILVGVLSILVLKAKGRLKDFKFWLLTIVSMILTFFIGTIISLIIVAQLTKLEKK